MTQPRCAPPSQCGVSSRRRFTTHVACNTKASLQQMHHGPELKLRTSRASCMFCQRDECQTQEHGLLAPDEQLQMGAQAFVGDLLQQPPMYSAIKVSTLKSLRLNCSNVNRMLDRAMPRCHVQLYGRAFPSLDSLTLRFSHRRFPFHQCWADGHVLASRDVVTFLFIRSDHSGLTQAAIIWVP